VNYAGKEASRNYGIALAAMREFGDRFHETMVLSNRAVLYLEQGHLASAQKEFLSALKLARGLGSIAIEAQNLGNLAIVCKRLGHIKQARNYYVRNIEMLATTHGRQRSLSITTGNLALLERSQGNYKKSREYLNRALELAIDIDSQRLRGVWLSELAYLDSLEGLTTHAMTKFEQARQILVEFNDQYSLARQYAYQGLCHAQSKQWNDARSMLAKTQEIATALNLAPESEIVSLVKELERALAPPPAQQDLETH